MRHGFELNERLLAALTLRNLPEQLRRLSLLLRLQEQHTRLDQSSLPVDPVHIPVRVYVQTDGEVHEWKRGSLHRGPVSRASPLSLSLAASNTQMVVVDFRQVQGVDCSFSSGWQSRCWTLLFVVGVGAQLVDLFVVRVREDQEVCENGFWKENSKKLRSPLVICLVLAGSCGCCLFFRSRKS